MAFQRVACVLDLQHNLISILPAAETSGKKHDIGGDITRQSYANKIQPTSSHYTRVE